MSPHLGSAGDLLLPVLALGSKWMLVGVMAFVCGPTLTRRERAQPVDESLT